ncbi:hypothetical protein IP88_00230 [alpha proteobacterium AAP81b]|nr:hypothetical protein IP88_00230 [alpha proteobacterium AAP81b]
MRVLPFNLLTFLIDDRVNTAIDFATRSHAAALTALDQARVAGDRAHFDRVALQVARCRQEVLALHPTANLPGVSLDFDAPALRRAA